MLKFVPVIRNKIDWHEHVGAGVVGGAVVGVLHSNPKALGLKEIPPAKLKAYRQNFVMKSTFYGLLLGVFLAALAAMQTNKEVTSREWAEYRKKHNIKH